MSNSYDNPAVAVLSALRDRVSPPSGIALPPSERLDRRVAVVTGANRGLGKAIAEGLGARGAEVVLACRGDASHLRIDRCRSLYIELADLRSVIACADKIDRVDVLVLNAGIVPDRSRATAQGLELQIGVNYLANVLFVDRLIARGAIGKSTRIIVVSSESHRDAKAMDLRTLGELDAYEMSGVMPRYSYSKLLLTSWAHTLARKIDARVYTICPGAVRSDIAREAPAWVKPFLTPIMYAFFAAPDVGAAPIVYLACARALDDRTGLYWHRWVEKDASELARDPIRGEALWNASHALLEKLV